MAGSQLKRLKASLKDQGIIGPQKSKKQKRQNAQDAKASTDKRLQRHEALASIREQFNPFQFKTSARGPKFEVTTNKPQNDKLAKGIQGRPGLAKATAEQRRKETLLVEMQRRNKVGGIVDRRFGEDDPNMTLEDKMMERFAREQMKSHKKNTVFDLEGSDDDAEQVTLTHAGKTLFDDDDMEVGRDDFDENISDMESDDERSARKKFLKRLRAEEEAAEGEGEDGQPERKKTKKEVMEEVIAKSKAFKYERQAAKEEDEDLRVELDKELRQVQSLLFQMKPKETKEPKGPATVAGIDLEQLEKEYNMRLKQATREARAEVTDRTKTEEERAEEGVKRLKEMEEKRLRRMRGEVVSDDEEEEEPKKGKKKGDDQEAQDEADEDEFGLGKGIKLRMTATEMGLDDEDDFLLEDDLIASGSELDMDEDDMSDVEGSDEEDAYDPDEDELVNGGADGESEEVATKLHAQSKAGDEDGIPYTFPCPESHEQLLDILGDLPVAKLPVAVQRIRALYHPKLNEKNKERLGNFTQALIEHIAYLGDNFEPTWFPAIENLIRHVHSLAKTFFAIEVSKAYRARLEQIKEERPLALTVGDLMLLTAIGTTYPTSDHFHQVVTPAMLSITRYLGQKIPQTLADYSIGAYLSILALQYQSFSKRYVPEFINFCLNTLCSLAAEKPKEKLGLFPVHEPAAGIRVKGASKVTVRKLNCGDCQQPKSTRFASEDSAQKVAIISTITSVLRTASETWCKLPAFYETFQPAQRVLQHLTTKSNAAQLPAALVKQLKDTTTSISRLLQLAQVSRRPLELHHHKPLAIKTYVPKFEDSFDPNKHYDPDRERAEMAKLRAEHKKERKGALRELRKDAAFMQRENLKVKKAKDEAYEKKYKRLVAEIQGSEGQASNEYAREKAARLKKNKTGNKW
ncbi:nucleolar protein 14 [Sordaria sp. MPI-SDFR-AT-0083]|nr:nucleolar protein 14 [Sordaria sp. MPI-SDFR-AT-0083]